METTLIHESVAHISLRLLEYLHGVEAFRMDQPSQSEAADEVFSSLLKEMLYASGTAAGQILPVITPFVGAAFTFNQSAGMLSCVNEVRSGNAINFPPFCRGMKGCDVFVVVIDSLPQQKWL